MTPLLIQFTLFLTVVVDAGLFVFLFLKRRPGPMYPLLLLHILGILGWAGSVLLLLTEESLFAAKLTFVYALVFAVAKYWFTLVFPENTLPSKRWHYWTLIPAFVLGIVAFFDNTLFTTLTVVDASYVIVGNGPVAGIYSLAITYFLLYPLFVLNRKYRKETKNTLVRKQLRYLFWGFTLSFVIALLTNSILPVFFKIYIGNGIGPTFSLLLAGFIAYIITRYQFLDIRLVVQRGIIYTLLLALTVSLYLSLVALFGYFFQKTGNVAILFSAGTTTLLGIFGTPIVERYFRKLTDPIFFKEQYDYAEATRDLAHVLNHHIALHALTTQSKEALMRILKTDHVLFLLTKNASEDETKDAATLEKLWDSSQNKAKLRYGITLPELTYAPHMKHSGEKAKQQGLLAALMEKYHAELVVPIILDEQLTGVLLMGSKRSGDLYSRIDRSLLENFASQVAVAFEKALLYEQVASYSAGLEQKVLERTQEITQLRQREQQMIVDISHGLQTPLAILKNELEKLQERFPDTKGIDAFERSVDMVSKFVYDLLTLSRLENLPEKESEESVDLSALLEELIEYVSIPAEAQKIHLSGAITPHIMVKGEKDRLKEAIINLLSNAIKYMKEGNPREIHVSVKSADKNAFITIEDTGIGIAANDLNNLFERFYRAGSGKTGQPKGTGLGLAITKRIVLRHRGTINVASTPGKGTCFTITLPREN